MLNELLVQAVMEERLREARERQRAHQFRQRSGSRRSKRRRRPGRGRPTRERRFSPLHPLGGLACRIVEWSFAVIDVKMPSSNTPLRARNVVLSETGQAIRGYLPASKGGDAR